MVLLMWNIRGLNGSKKRHESLTIMASVRHEIVGLMETQVRRRNQMKVMRSFIKSWEGLSNFENWEIDKGNSIWVL